MMIMTWCELCSVGYGIWDMEHVGSSFFFFLRHGSSRYFHNTNRRNPKRIVEKRKKPPRMVGRKRKEDQASEYHPHSRRQSSLLFMKSSASWILHLHDAIFPCSFGTFFPPGSLTNRHSGPSLVFAGMIPSVIRWGVWYRQTKLCGTLFFWRGFVGVQS